MSLLDSEINVKMKCTNRYRSLSINTLSPNLMATISGVNDRSNTIFLILLDILYQCPSLIFINIPYVVKWFENHHLLPPKKPNILYTLLCFNLLEFLLPYCLTFVGEGIFKALKEIFKNL